MNPHVCVRAGMRVSQRGDKRCMCMLVHAQEASGVVWGRGEGNFETCILSSSRLGDKGI